MKNNFILSICIPTYNRSKYLRATVDSIVSQSDFVDGKVQICISDNCSTDDTNAVVDSFLLIHPDKIKYNRNKENNWDINFETVLRMGDGKYLKLCNDTLQHDNGSLEYIISMINMCPKDMPLLFLGNYKILVNSLDQFIKEASYLMTWIACFGVWREELNGISDFSRASKTNLIQVDSILRIISQRQKAMIVPFKYFHINYNESKGPYNFNKIFVDNYLKLISDYVLSGSIMPETFEFEKRKLLLKFCAPWAGRSIVGYQSNFSVTTHFRFLMKWYWNCPHILLIYLIKIILYAPYFFVLKLKNIINKNFVF